MATKRDFRTYCLWFVLLSIVQFVVLITSKPENNNNSVSVIYL